MAERIEKPVQPQLKMQLLALAISMYKEDKELGSIIQIYLDLREEVLNIPNPNNPVDPTPEPPLE